MTDRAAGVEEIVEPVFVVGMNGSGTTMLADCLGRHPDFYMFPRETRVLPYLMRRAGRGGDLDRIAGRRELADGLGRSRAFRLENGGRAVRVADEELASVGFAATVDAVYRRFARAQGKTRWGEKTPMYVQHMVALGRHFPHARFLHIYRDGRDAARSFHRRWGFEPRRTIYRWKNVIADGRRQGAQLGPGRYLEIRYEELTAEPEAVLRRVCAFVGLAFVPAVLTSSMRYADPALAARGQGRIVANSGGWLTYFTPGEQVALERIAGRMLDELGYEVRHCRGDADPPALALALWQMGDRLRSARRQLRVAGWHRLSLLWQRARESLIQGQTNRY